MKTLSNVAKINPYELLVKLDEPSDLKDGRYKVTIEKVREGRTIRQNRYMWALIGEISKAQNGNLEDNDKIYIDCLVKAGAKYEVFFVDHNAIDFLKEGFKTIKIYNQLVVNGRVMDQVYVFHGSSTFNTSEMTVLIDEVLKLAESVGVRDMSYWKGILND